MGERSEFTLEVRAHLAVKPEGTSLSLRGEDANGALLLPMRPEDVPIGSVVRLAVEKRPADG